MCSISEARENELEVKERRKHWKRKRREEGEKKQPMEEEKGGEGELMAVASGSDFD